MSSSSSSTARVRGQLVADFLAGSWRAQQTAPEISSSDLEQLAALLYNSGGAGLAWWRIHESDFSHTPCGELLHQGYRMQALQTPINEERIVRAYRLLRAAAIEPILIKGWAASQLYPHRTLRPYGDIDLVVRPQEYSKARAALQQDDAGTWWVDLHQGLAELDDRSLEEVFERTRMLPLGEVQVRVLSGEDHLALLAIHLFKHGAWRPSWLCDIAATVEALPENFDEQVCFGSKKNRSAWISCAIALAHQLLDAKVERLASHVRPSPEWVTRAVLEQWGNLFQPQHLPIQPRPVMAYALRNPRTLIKEACERWPSPIVATFNLGGAPNNLPRLPFQLGAFARQAGKYLFDHRRATWD